MKRKEFLKNTGLGLGAGFMDPKGLLGLNKNKSIKDDSKPTWSGERPNILWITCEDTSLYFFSFYGDSTIKTPNLSWLASDGIVFDRMFSTYGVCAPSRSSIITGMYPESIGAMDMRTTTVESRNHVPGLVDYQVVPPPEVRCFTEYLRAAGYYCTNNSKTDYQFKSPVTAWDENSNSATWRHRSSGQPFYSVFNLGITHTSRLWLREDKPLLVDPDKVPIPVYFPQNDSVVKRQVARMYSNIMLMDKQVGELIDKLKQDHLLDNTIIIFCSDHGGPLPWYKHSLYDRGTHVPFIVRFPDGWRSGTRDTELHSFVDMAPTMLSLTGVPVPNYLQGQAFLGSKKARHPRKYIFTGRDRGGPYYKLMRSARDKRYQYIRNYTPDKNRYSDTRYRLQMPIMEEIVKLKEENNLNSPIEKWFSTGTPEELYDLKKDPHELHNLAGDPSYSSILQRMRQAVNGWERRIGDKGFYQERDLIKLMWPRLKQPVTKDPLFKKIEEKGSADVIEINCPTQGASIAYRLNTNPQDHWNLYIHPISLPRGAKIQSKAIRIGYKESSKKTYPSN